ncbi:methylmalonyl-CoA mutase family protein [uncultured Pyramidobacter sp.]|uniref:methylmalonyl-CoA mutase family protein n=1 Tax=uncultured Pyramidobacter sp. TaxID=1623495 RepID=UPI00258D3971|nr:methylmalonyl-CoA mutase family protein [uncultured Pyramidobacter sp.]
MEKDQQKSAPITPVTFDEFKVPTYEEWKQAAEAALKGAPFDKKMFTPTCEGITLQPIYTAEDVKDLKDCQTFPGEQDYLRGVRSAPAHGKLWEIAQGIDARCPRRAGELAAEELKRGATAIHPVLDYSSTHGMDVPACEHRGVSICSLEHLEKFFADADPSAHELHVAAGASALPMLGMIAAWCKNHGVAPSSLKGCVGADPIGALARDGSLSRSLGSLYDEMAQTLLWAENNQCALRTVLIRGSVYADAGASAVQETACALADAVAVIRAMSERGIAPEVTARHLRFEVGLGANFFMEIARLRALRVLWAHVARAFGCEGESAKVNVIAETSPFTVTVYDPYVNILRTSTQAFSAAVAGVDSMNVNCFDWAVRPATEQARRIARNQQIMMQTEFNLDAAVDPAGGSWYVETLTRQVEDRAWELFQKVEAEGGIVKALQSGLIQNEIGAVLADRFKKLATRAERAVGNNMYANMAETPLDVPASDLAEFKAAREAKVAKIKKRRCPDCLAKALKDVAESSKCGKGGQVVHAAEAFAADALLSDLWKTLDAAGPCDLKVAPLEPHRWTEQYEALRKRTEDYAATTGGNVKVFLANMGPIPQHKPRADFSTGFFEVGHFEVLKNDGFETVELAAAAAAESGADAAVICSTDDTYPELVPPLARLIKQKRPDMTVFLAGAPAPEFKQSYLDAGVDDFIHVKANCLQVLSAMQKKKGMC